jgi:hypothetical protein
MIFVKQNDRRPPAYALLKRGDVVVDLTLAQRCTFKMRRTGRTELKVDALAVIGNDPTLGEVEYRWAAGDTDTSGEYLAEWEVLWTDGTLETFPTIDYDYVSISPDLDGSV